jgi:mxaK protein
MALSSKRTWVTLAIVIGLLSAVLLIVSLIQLQRAARFNQALEQENYALAAQDASPYGVFAKAFMYQQKSEFDTAIEHYAHIENEVDKDFQQVVHYNMATLYMQRAMVVRQAGDHDIATPLIELSKHLYKQLLRFEPTHWPAKYNLEQALKLAPEIKKEEFPDDVMPERSPEATGSIIIDRELP